LVMLLNAILSAKLGTQPYGDMSGESVSVFPIRI
jgi:hypothetical protein